MIYYIYMVYYIYMFIYIYIAEILRARAPSILPDLLSALFFPQGPKPMVNKNPPGTSTLVILSW